MSQRSIYSVCLMVSLCLAGCGINIPLRREYINDTAFKSPEALQTRVDSLLKILSEGKYRDKEIFQKDVFEILAIDDKICEWLLPDAIRAIVYPGFELRGDSVAQEEYTKRIQDHRVCVLKYVHLERTGKFGIQSVDVTLKGHDQKLALVFDKNKPINIIIAGRAIVNDIEVVFLWDYLGSFMASFTSKGGTEAVTALGGI